MSKALTARDIGQTSLNLTQLGQNSAQLWTQLAEQAYSPWSTSTSQQAAVTAANNAGEQATKQFGFNVKAAPDPGALGIFNVDAALGQQMLALGGSFAGSAFGGGGTSAQAPRGVPYGSYPVANSTAYLSPGGIPYGNIPSAWQYNVNTGGYTPPAPSGYGGWG